MQRQRSWYALFIDYTGGRCWIFLLGRRYYRLLYLLSSPSGTNVRGQSVAILGYRFTHHRGKRLLDTDTTQSRFHLLQQSRFRMRCGNYETFQGDARISLDKPTCGANSASACTARAALERALYALSWANITFKMRAPWHYFRYFRRSALMLHASWYTFI